MVQTANAQLRAPWSFRLFDATGIAPIWVGVGIAGLLLGAYFGVEYARGQISAVLSGSAEPHIPAHFRSIAIHSIMLGFLPTALVYLARWSRENYRELEPLLRPVAGDERMPEEWLTPLPTQLAGIIGIGVLFVAFFIVPGTITQWADLDYWVFEHTFEIVLLFPMGWLGGRLLWALRGYSVRISQLASRLESVDLLDLAPLYPFVRQGLRSALIAVLAVSIVMAHLGSAIIPTTGLYFTAAAMFAVATSSLLLPVRGVRQRIREEKHKRLAELREAIKAGERDALTRNRAVDNLPGLLALEARVEAVREWPFDTPSVVRFFFYVSLGLGSWIGGAAVERLLDHLLKD